MIDANKIFHQMEELTTKIKEVRALIEYNSIQIGTIIKNKDLQIKLLNKEILKLKEMYDDFLIPKNKRV